MIMKWQTSVVIDASIDGLTGMRSGGQEQHDDTDSKQSMMNHHRLVLNLK